MEASFHARFLLVGCSAPPVERKGKKSPVSVTPESLAEFRRRSGERASAHLRSSGRVRKPPVSVTPESLAEFRRRGGERASAYLRSSGKVKKSPVSVTPESLTEFRRRSGERASAYLRSSGKVRRSPVSVTSENPAPDGAGFCVFCCLLRQSGQRRHSVASEMRP